MAGMLVTYFQQLVAYRESTRFLKTFAANQKPVPIKKTMTRPIQQENYEQPEVYDETQPQSYDETQPQSYDETKLQSFNPNPYDYTNDAENEYYA